VIRKSIHNAAALLLFFSLLFVACTQYKNKPINRGYHNMTSRFNVYFYAKESMKEGVTKLEENHKDDYTKLLPVFIYGDKETSKEIYPEMDRVIKKSSLCITRHAIKDKKTKVEVFGAVKWIDNAWMELGKAHFYKREFFSAIETFEFVAASYKSKEKYEAWLWLVKTYNEMGLLSQSDPYINLIKNDPKFPKQFKGEFDALHAEFYIKQGLTEEAIKKLNEAISHTKNKKKKARFHFILGQLYEVKGEEETKKAVAQYKKTLAKKPAYEMEFNTRIKLALLAEYTPATAKKLKYNLLKMLKDVKNEEYKDVIYYTLGQLEERDQNYDVAFGYYKQSAANSKTNNVQKSKSYLRIAEMSFDREDFPSSKTYYDSTLVFMKDDYPGYKEIVNKQKSLDVLVGHITTIREKDSLLKLADMDTATRNNAIRKMIAKIEEQEQKEKELKEQQQADNNNPDNQGNAPNTFQPTAGTGAWYFYNPQTKLFGINDFIKKWGNQRKNEDNWRRLNKQSTIEPWQNGTDSSDTAIDSTKAKKDSVITNTKTVAFYLKDIPLTKAQQDTAHKQILESYYALGTIYREQLSNNKRAVNTFTRMNEKYPGNKYEASSYYQMYRIYLLEKNQAKADEMKNLILARYPDSDYALIIKDPNFANAVNAKKNEVEAFYSKTYDLYTQANFGQALANTDEALRKYSKNEFTPKFAYLRALCISRTQPLDSTERALKLVVAKYPDDAVYTPAKAMLDAIQKAKNPNAAVVDTNKVKPVVMDPDAYKVRDSIEHYWVVVIPQNRGEVSKFKIKLSDFNTQYFSGKKYLAQTLIIGTETVVFLKTFDNKEDVLSYSDFIMKKPDVFADLQKEVMSVFSISTDNMVKLIKRKNIAEYKAFYNANYVPKKNP
jgi:tetratricopeptide (TPR) repeat protein